MKKILFILLLAICSFGFSQTMNYEKMDSILNLEYNFQVKNIKSGIIYPDSIICYSDNTVITTVYKEGELIFVYLKGYLFKDINFLFLENKYYLSLEKDIWGVKQINKQIKLCKGL
jgi:hypothetical protein